MKNIFILIKKGQLSLNIRCHNFVADLPARAAFLNFKQFNGYYGCLNCFHPGEYNETYGIFVIFGIKGETSLSKLFCTPDQIPYD